MGLERTAAVLQGVETNFHIDILRPLVEAAGEVCRVRYDPADENGRRLRRIADHLRACAFAVHENVYPGNKKQGYVIRRLLRRAVLDGHQMGVREPFLHKLVGRVAELMKHPYPELGQTVTAVAGVIEKEEANFLATLDAGLERIERVFEQMHQRAAVHRLRRRRRRHVPNPRLPARTVRDPGRRAEPGFDWKGFQAEMEQHGIDSGGGQKIEVFRHDPLEGLKKALHGSRFLGYETLEVAGRQGGRHRRQRPTLRLRGRSGPRTADRGGARQDPVLRRDGRASGRHRRDRGAGCQPAAVHFEVIDAMIDGGFTLHRGHLREGRIELGATVTARVDPERRQGIRRAHSATHLLHYALQKHLGKHALQQGSKVDDDWLRFDFANPSAVSEEELVRIENEVNEKILAGEPIGSTNLPLAEARKSGAMMLFGEKYPDVVRMVSAGDFSKELCGGTHLSNTALVGIFKIIGEESVAAGTRRITALTGRRAMESIRTRADAPPPRRRRAAGPARRIARAGRSPGQGNPPIEEAGGGRAEKRRRERRSTDCRRRGRRRREGGDCRSARRAERTAADDRPVAPQGRAGGRAAGQPAGRREEGDADCRPEPRPGRPRPGRGEVGQGGGGIVEGGGGGRPDMAQAGGKLPEKLPEALEAARRESRSYWAFSICSAGLPATVMV